MQERKEWDIVSDKKTVSKGKNREIMVSICIICYNHAKTIEQAVNSVLEQKVGFYYEIIIGDDASRDRTAEILNDKFKNRQENIRIITRERNIGGTRNSADIIKRARGKYLITLEGDDYWEKNDTLQYMVYFLEKHPEFEGISGVRKKLDYKDKVIGDNHGYNKKQRVITLKKYLNNESFDLSATLFRNRSFDLQACINGSRKRGDLTWAILILENGPIYKIDKYLGFYRSISRAGHSNYNSQNNIWEQYIDVIQILKYLEKYHNPRHSYIKRYMKESKKIFRYILSNKEVALLKKMLILLGPIRFIRISLLCIREQLSNHRNG